MRGARAGCISLAAAWWSGYETLGQLRTCSSSELRHSRTAVQGGCIHRGEDGDEFETESEIIGFSSVQGKMPVAKRVKYSRYRRIEWAAVNATDEVPGCNPLALHCTTRATICPVSETKE